MGLASPLGGAARFWLSGAVAILLGEAFPFGTLIINILGSFVIGFFGAITGPDGRFLVAAVSRQTLNLVNDGEWLFAGLNASLSVALCLFAVWMGHFAAVFLNHSS